MTELVRTYKLTDSGAWGWVTEEADGGGGSVVQTREQFFGEAVSIADNAFANVTWDSPTGDVLVNVTDPTEPVVIESGVYIVAVSVKANNMTVGGRFDVFLYLDADGVGALQRGSSGPSVAAAQVPACQVCFAWYIPAGGTIYTQVFNYDGAASRDFTLGEAEIQRVS